MNDKELGDQINSVDQIDHDCLVSICESIATGKSLYSSVHDDVEQVPVGSSPQV